MKDWFRRKSWTKVDEAEFFMKLGRARKDGRAQYLRIQAAELVETGNKKLLNVAESLINKMLTDYPDDDLERSSALDTLGDIYRIRKNYEKAIDYYKAAVDFEKKYPNVETDAYLSYSELIVKTGKIKHYNYVESLLNDKLADEFFPLTLYMIYSILSIINSYKGRPKKAKLYAELAEQNANEETSGLRYHKYLGIVEERDALLDKLVKHRQKG